MIKLIIIMAILMAGTVYAWEPLPTYHNQELFRNFTNAALMSKNYGTFHWAGCTESMKPEITCNDTLIIVRVWGKAKEGDIIVASSQDKSLWQGKPDYIIHRVVSVWKTYADNKTYYVTKGDNNEFQDPMVAEPRHFNWRVVGIWRKN